MSEMIYTSDRKTEILHEEMDRGFRVLILSLGTHPCIYIGVESNHALAGHDYDDIPVGVHGGLTYSAAGDGDYLPEGYWFYGWDYAHAGDYSGYDAMIFRDRENKKWGIKELKQEASMAVWDFEKIRDLIEKVLKKEAV